MTPFSFTPTPANKSPTSTVNPDGRGNGQPGGQLDVGQAARAVDAGVGYFAAMSLFGVEHVLSVEQQRTKSVAGLWPVGGAS